MTPLVRTDPLYRQIVAQLDAVLQDLPRGTRLPTVAASAAQFGVCRQSIERAYQILAERGRVYVVAGHGAFAGPRPRTEES